MVKRKFGKVSKTHSQNIFSMIVAKQNFLPEEQKCSGGTAQGKAIYYLLTK